MWQLPNKCLDQVGLGSFRDRPYTRLSGGESQLVLIARALAQETGVIVMDEVTAHLDFRHELMVLETIVALVKKTDLAVIMATHFPNHAFYLENNGLAVRVGLMKAASFAAMGTPAAVLTEDNLRRLYGIDARIVSLAVEGQGEIKQVVPIRQESD